MSTIVLDIYSILFSIQIVILCIISIEQTLLDIRVENEFFPLKEDNNEKEKNKDNKKLFDASRWISSY